MIIKLAVSSVSAISRANRGNPPSCGITHCRLMGSPQCVFIPTTTVDPRLRIFGISHTHITIKYIIYFISTFRNAAVNRDLYIIYYTRYRNTFAAISAARYLGEGGYRLYIISRSIYCAHTYSCTYTLTHTCLRARANKLTHLNMALR